MNLQSVTINEQGQIIIPKVFREYLKSNTLIIQKNEEDNSIKLIPIPDLAGSLSQYSTKKTVDFSEERKQAWNEEIHRFKKNT